MTTSFPTKPGPIADRRALSRVMLRGLMRFAVREIREEGPLHFLRTIVGSALAREFRPSPDRSFGEELHEAARRRPDRVFVTFEGRDYTLGSLDAGAARIAGGLLARGHGRGAVVGVFLPNSPTFLEVVFASQRVGACLVPINTALVGDGLRYVIDNAGVDVLFTTAALKNQVDAVAAELTKPPLIVVVPDGDSGEAAGAVALADWIRATPQETPDGAIPPNLPCFLMYTSGTTGYPKGVVYRYGHSQAKLTRLSAHLLLREDDVYYTCLPLFHANALFVTTLSALYAGARVALSRRFSAGRFWHEVKDSGATIFNTIGTMVGILMKTPPSPADRAHRVRTVLSAACPSDLWAPFGDRFGVTLWEAFGAVDGGGFTTFNFGNAPAGSVGKPLGRKRWRLIDDEGRDVGPGEPGELVHYVGGSRHGQIAYHRNDKATDEKLRDGWIHSGDLMWRDSAGFLYFVGRRTDSMRCRGENVSALEVETAADKHPDVLESAAFGIASELGEQDVMVVVQPREGHTVDPAALADWLADKLPRFAQPRYIRVVAALPKTGTHRVIKPDLKAEGVTADTWQAPERAAREAS